MKKTPCKPSRRGMIIKTFYGLSALSTLSLLGSCNNSYEEEITPAEDLMREHGILRRIMLIYDACRMKLLDNQPVDPPVLVNSAQIVRTVIEEYHEKLEENYLFPAFDNNNKLTELVETLKVQHKAGRTITDQIMKTAGTAGELQGASNNNLVTMLANFNIMYRAHASREDTVLFPAIREIMPGKKFRDLGEEFERIEMKTLGKKGFENAVKQVEAIEKSLGIYELEKYNRQ